MLGYKKFNAGLSRSLHEHPYDPEGTPGPSYSIPPFVSKAYLNKLDCLKKETFYEKPLILADRDMVETQSDDILRDADKEDVSLLVVGDPFG